MNHESIPFEFRMPGTSHWRVSANKAVLVSFTVERTNWICLSRYNVLFTHSEIHTTVFFYLFVQLPLFVRSCQQRGIQSLISFELLWF